MSLKHLHIAVGIIRNDEGEIFITQRGGDSHLSGLWEEKLRLMRARFRDCSANY